MKYDSTMIGYRIRNIREHMNLSQTAFAEKVGAGREHIAKIELGKKGLSIDLLIEIAEFGNVSLDYLVFGRDERDQIKHELTKILRAMTNLTNKL